MLKRQSRRLAGVSLILLFLVSCATHQAKLSGPRDLIRAGQYTEAAEELKKLTEESGGDKLLFLMEYGTALRIAGRFKESNQAFLQADKLSDELDYHSVSRVAIAALGSEEMLQYKGESYEKLLINAYLAMNFIALGDRDAAMVEVRRINDKVNKLRADGRSDYEYNPFAIYLSALIWEADRRFDDAYIAYEKAYKLAPGLPALPTDLVRSAKLARRMDTYEKWKREFPQVKEDSSWYDNKLGEVIVVYEQGWGPKKDYSYADHRIPQLVPQSSMTKQILVKANNNKAYSTKVYDLEAASITTLNADYQWMVARKIGAFIAKEVVSDQIRQKDETLGLIANLIMHVSDRADLRNWVTLPQTVQVARLRLPAGTYKVDIQGLDAWQSPTADVKEGVEVKLRAGQKQFISYRSLR